MEIVEKQVEKIKEVPYGYWDGCDNSCNRGHRYASKGVAGTALGLSIGALAWTALKNGNGGFNLFGNNCNETTATQKSVYDLALLTQNERFTDRQTINQEMFGIYKSQVDADFGLYKSQRDGFDVLTGKHNADAFALYKSQRDGDDALAARISALETKQAVDAAIEPWRAKVLEMQINGVAAGANSAVALEAERRCCADNKIVSYVNGNFYPVSVADVTTGTTTTQRTTYNPLCGCCNPVMGF